MTSRPGRRVQRRLPDRGVDLGLRALAVQELEVLAVLGRLVDPVAELVDLVRLVGEGDAMPTSSRSQSMPCARVKSTRPRRLSRPSASSRSSSSGKCLIPLARPWVRLDWQKPPLRPLAPNPTVACSRTATRSAGVRVGQGDRRPQPGEAGPDDGHVDVESVARAERPVRRAAGAGVAEPVDVVGRDGAIVRMVPWPHRIVRITPPAARSRLRDSWSGALWWTKVALTRLRPLWHDGVDSRPVSRNARPTGRAGTSAGPAARGPHDHRARHQPDPQPPPRPAARAVPARFEDAARWHELELPGVGRVDRLHRPRPGRPDLGHGRQRVRRPADGLWPGHPRPRRRPRRRLRQRADAPRASASR